MSPDVLRARLAELALAFANGIADVIAEDRGAPSLARGPGTVKTRPRRVTKFAAPRFPVSPEVEARAVVEARKRGIRLGG